MATRSKSIGTKYYVVSTFNCVGCRRRVIFKHR
ncbi:hypothetical protein CCACVL1_16614 [Corchorus capsularis]|uniref:Uncharacterized protein n=1 Tax=Corchorus capsularis TaxID=210143 RepID=A0A1R3HW04_COCAP|nr:hypothetical protein CCACVL1_16614 [Corchorus capsularis]